MENIAIATPLISDLATLTAGSAAADMPVSNLLTQQPSDVWRATDLTNSYVVIDLGSAQTINLLALLYTNASSVATWRIRAATSQANLTASPGYDSGSLTMWPDTGLASWDWTHAFKWFSSSPKTYRWWRIDVSDAANTDGYFQSGRLYLSNAWQPAHNIAYGWGLQFVDFSTKVLAAGGQIIPGSKPLHRDLKFSLKFATETDLYDNAFDIDRLRGTSGDVLVMRDPSNTSRLMKQSIYGTFTTLGQLINSAFSIYEKDYEVEEMTP